MKNIFIFTIFLVLCHINTKCQLTVFRYPSPFLYKHCNNAVILSEVCDREMDIDYVFDGGKIEISDSNRLHIRLFPIEDSCFLTIFEQKNGLNQFLMKMKCKVIEPPAPYIEVIRKNGITTLIQDTMNLKAGDTLIIKAIPDPDFAANFPNEIQYKPESVFMEFLPKPKDMRQKAMKQQMANMAYKWENNQMEWVIPVNIWNKSLTLCINHLCRTDSKGYRTLVSETVYFQPNRKIFVHVK